MINKISIYIFKGSWIALCLMIHTFDYFAQGEYNNWYFGDSAGVAFNGGAPVSLSNGKLSSYEGCSSISDNTGNLLFYSDGINVWNKNHFIMPNGTGLMGNNSSTQSTLIVPQPGSTTIYYLFTTDAQEGSGLNGLRYSIIDMTLQGGLGDVTIKNTLLLAPIGEHLTACRNASGCAFWVLSQKKGTNAFYAYMLTDKGVDTIPVISNSGPMQFGSHGGTLKINRQGTKMVRASLDAIEYDFFDFDNTTGQISNFFATPKGLYGESYSMEFSSDGNMVYGSHWYGQVLFQWNLLAGNGSPADVMASQYQTEPYNDTYFGQLQLGPDDKIYLARHDKPWLGVINNPNSAGAACNYVHDGVSLAGRQSQLGLPNFPVNPPIISVPISCFIPDFYFYNVCLGDTTLFKNTSRDSVFKWNFGDPVSDINNTSLLRNPKHLFSSIGTFSISLISGTGSTADTIIKSITIQSGNFLTVSPDMTVCSGETVTLTASGGLAGWTKWTGWDDHYGDTATFTNYSNGSSVTYFVTGYNGTCYDTDTLNITVNTLPDAIISTASTICNGQSTSLTASGGGTYLWNTGSTDSTLAVSPQNNEVYWVAVSINSCIADTAKTTVTVLSNPTLSLGETMTIAYGTGVVITNTNSGIYQWTPATGLSCTDCASPIATPTKTTTYYATVTNTNKCEVTDSITIVVYVCGDVFVPSAFSPNNDGNNDVLFANINCAKEVDFKIFDRWGNKVFETTDSIKGWNGTYKEKEMNPAVFVYYVNVTLISGEQISKKGNISLVR